MFVCVGFPGFLFLVVGSLYVGCVGVTVAGVSSDRGLLRVVGGRGCGVMVFLVLSLVR